MREQRLLSQPCYIRDRVQTGSFRTREIMQEKRADICCQCDAICRAMPIDVKKSNIDFLVFAGYKWMMLAME